MLYCIYQQKKYKYIKRPFKEQISKIKLIFPQNNGKKVKRKQRKKMKEERKEGRREGRKQISNDLGYFLVFN